jgi:hypothetical protein
MALVWALLGDGAQELVYLRVAAKHGWLNVAHTRGQGEFSKTRPQNQPHACILGLKATSSRKVALSQPIE